MPPEQSLLTFCPLVPSPLLSQEIRRSGDQEWFVVQGRISQSSDRVSGRQFMHWVGLRHRCRYCQPRDPPARKASKNQLARFVRLESHMTTSLAGIEELTERIIGCAIEVHRILGPGLLESVYRECMIIEMRRAHLRVESEPHIPLDYKGQRISSGLRLDILVEGCLVLELKAVERLHPIYLAQVITYLKLTGCPAGLLMNFNATTLRAGLRRLDHPDLYVKKDLP
jgi:GxxExxY protein